MVHKILVVKDVFKDISEGNLDYITIPVINVMGLGDIAQLEEYDLKDGKSSRVLFMNIIKIDKILHGFKVYLSEFKKT